ncbi:MAG: hypothetical protein A2W98_08950 [Bacteroidetes bacterium GWF2_33_38]|nr:MAG: hypothetical protein A2W98_08950 [Bacteroidetes bacterium GWF2_33_38]OFY87352.1 MAG: hypothetical protein A2236_12585 [Bacteroidetes bacterium RIFOXYA2_FULL_33_7]
MTILQAINQPENTGFLNWCSVNFMNIITTIAAIINACYVLYTIKTFKEIKKQTDLQLKAHLSFDTKVFKDSELTKPNTNKEYLDLSFGSDWKKSMQIAFPELSDPGLFDGAYYCIIIANYGNTEVKQISFEIEVIIENSKNIVDTKKLTTKETKNTIIKVNEILCKSASIIIPVFSIAAFPIYTVLINGKYVDVRNQEYSILQIKDKKENKYLQ